MGKMNMRKLKLFISENISWSLSLSVQTTESERQKGSINRVTVQLNFRFNQRASNLDCADNTDIAVSNP